MKLLVLVLALQADDAPSRHGWLNWRHVLQVLTSWHDSSRIQRAFMEADRVVAPGENGKRGRAVEQEAIRRLARASDLLPNVMIVEVDGVRRVAGIGDRTVSLGGPTVGEADVLKLKPGRTIAIGDVFDATAVERAWDYKLPDRPMKSSQRARYREVFGVEPIEIHPTPVGRAMGRRTAEEAGGAAQFVAAYLIKEAMNGRNALPELAEPRFWGSVGAFTVASRVSEKFLRGPVLPLAIGMAAAQAVNGRVSPREVLLGTASYFVAGLAVGWVADGLVYPILFAAGPPGWAAAAAYTIAKTALTLYVGEKLEAFFRDRTVGTPGRDGGVRRILDRLTP